MGRLVHIDKLGERVGLSVQWLRKLSGAGVIPKIENSKVDEVEALVGLCKYWREQSEDVDDELLSARTRKVTAEAERQELALARDREAVLPRDEVKAHLLETFGLIRSELLMLPAIIPGAVVGIEPREAQVVVRKIIYNTLRHLTNLGKPLKKVIEEDAELQQLIKDLRSRKEKSIAEIRDTKTGQERENAEAEESGA